MNDRIKQLVNIILDPSARIDEKDDAIMYLGELGDLNAIDILVKVGSDELQDYILKSSVGESIARIMITTNIFNSTFLTDLCEEAKNEAFNLILGQKPEWEEKINSC